MRKNPQRHPAAARLCVSLLLATIAGGCASAAPAFSSRFPDNQEADARQLLSRLRAAPASQPLAIAVGVTEPPTQLFAYDVAARSVLWKTPVQLGPTPVLTDDAVVTQEGSDVVVRDLRTGKRRLVIEAGDGHLNGAGGTAAATALTLTRGQGSFARARIVLAAGGSVRWEKTLHGQAGAPTVAGNVVLVPWNHGFLSGLDAVTGDEFARVRVTDGVVGHVFREGKNVFVGNDGGITQVDEAFVSGRFRTDAVLLPPDRELPGRPHLMRNAYDDSAFPPANSARHSIRIASHVQPVEGGKSGYSDGALYLVFYRLILALDASDLSVRWAAKRPSDVVGAAAQPGGLLVAGRGGDVALLSAASGVTAWEDDKLPAATSVVFPMADAPAEGVDSAPPSEEALRKELHAVASDGDSRLVPIRMMAIEVLAESHDPQTTGDLLGLCEDTRMAPPVREAACAALHNRQAGGDQVMAALDRRYSYLKGTSAPPVGALGMAAAAIGEKGAVEPLIAHLQDPHTKSTELAPLVDALQALGDPRAAAPLASFMLTYHADIIDPPLAQALERIPHALVALQGKEAEPALVTVVGDRLTAAGLRAQAEDALHHLQAPDQVETAEGEAAPTAEGDGEATAKPEAKPEPPKPAGPPRRLTAQMFEKLLLPQDAALQACLRAGKQIHVQARLVVVVEDGSVMMVSVLPKELQKCIEPIVRTVTFPHTTSSRRDHINFTLKRH